MAPRRRIASLLRKINVLRVPSAAGRSIIGSLRDHMAEPSKETVIIVHGTWATPDPLKRRWYEPDDGRPGGEPFPAKLDAALRERGSPARCWAHCSQGNRIFQWWPGENSWMARTRAASALAGYVTKLRNDGWLCHFVAHSHGGNVLLEALLIGALNVAYHVRIKLGGRVVGKSLLPFGADIQAKPLLLAIGSRMDEAWQILHHFRSIDNPLMVRSRLFRYIFSSMRSSISQNTTVRRLLGAKSYRDIGYAAKLATAVMHLVTLLFVVWGGYAYYYALTNPGFLGDIFAILFISFVLVPLLIIILVGLTMLFGVSVLSAYFSPLRFCFQLIGSLGIIPAEIGTYLIRLKGWSVILKLAMGLDGYPFELPVIAQFPQNFPKALAVYEDMPKGAEQRALDRRKAWIARHLGGVSETFSKLTVSGADMTSLLRTVEEDQTLVHAAYYTDDECIVRIADWIAGKG
jgi:hypothetical protein